MSIPRDHHYLPQAYLERWTRNGKLFRYIRPRGPNGPLDCKQKSPKAVAYERDLYRLRDVEDPRESQSLELKFFQQIDDRGIQALRQLDSLERGTGEQRVALSQFMISLMHRSPSRLQSIRKELAERLGDAPEGVHDDPRFDGALSSTANRLLASLVGSPRGAEIVSRFKVFKVTAERARNRFLTSDRPITVSSQLIARDAFMILPYGPDRIAILCHDEEIARAFSSQDPDTLVHGINSAVVEQSKDVIIASDRAEGAMIARTFLRPRSDVVFDPVGLIRRKSPFTDLRPRVRTFSSRNKKAMLYLGRDP